ncbi:uncharacterized protein LOC130766563 [Actinidia eriantha]|uniref:uncharacterized protein LOC130766563 n=1 Tax=Actinidia eriantha TaxID=165200 RepID=UPI0025867E5F|nr:uncharacterized protein LOC130766563 [Actinidia eriantha]
MENLEPEARHDLCLLLLNSLHFKRNSVNFPTVSSACSICLKNPTWGLLRDLSLSFRHSLNNRQSKKRALNRHSRRQIEDYLQTPPSSLFRVRKIINGDRHFKDVQEIVSKLLSDKAKTREEGIKLLNTWLEGERSIGLCRYIAHKTAMLKLNEILHSETWPFLITLLTQCAWLEISSSKRRLLKLIFAKTLRIVVHRAEDTKFSEN